MARADRNDLRLALAERAGAAVAPLVERGPCGGHLSSRDPFSIAGPVPDFLGACDATLAGLRVAWSPTLGYARPDKEVVVICEKAARSFEHLGCSVELVEGVGPVESRRAVSVGGLIGIVVLSLVIVALRTAQIRAQFGV